MSLYAQDNTLPAALILSAGIALGLAGGGWLVGQGLARFKGESRSVTVKGLVEREVKSDQAVWALNLRFVVTKFNDLRPELLAAATKNARSIAEQFAADSGAKVGGIHSANQGTIQIFGTDGNDESAPFSPTSTPAKKIRVVSTFEFELK